MLFKKISISICLLICFGFVFISEVSAEEPNAKECIDGKVDCNELQNDNSKGTSTDQDEEKSGSIVFSLIKMFFALILVLALIYLLLKFLNKRNKMFQKVKALENVGGISVGQGKSIQIIRIGNRVYVVGVGDNVELLHEITDENEKNELLHINQSNEFQQGTLFSSFLNKKKSDAGSTSQSKADFKNLFASELAKLKNGRKKMIDHHKRKGDKDE